MTTVLAVLAGASLSVCLLQLAAAWVALRRRRRGREREAFTPPVTVLKPLKGVDDRLLDNLESFCRQDYPDYEIVFCLQSPTDPSVRVARRVRDRHPEREISIVVADGRAGLNPKVSNLMPGYARARHPYVLISDSNVVAAPGYLREAVSHLRDPSVGLVCHLVRGVGGRSTGARFENAHLNTFILGSVSLLDRFFGIPCVVGKSMLMRKSDLDALGGLDSVKDLLAEDYVLGDRFRKAGLRVVVSGEAVDTVNVHRGVKEFLVRHARWNRMRLSIAGPAYFAELLCNPVPFGLLLAAVSGGSRVGLLAAAAVLAAKLLLDAGMHLLLDAPARLRDIALGPARDLLAAGIWFSAFFSRKVEWRGRTYRIGRGSRLIPEEVEAPPLVAPASSTGDCPGAAPGRAVA